MANANISTVKKEQCTGCGACKAICTKDAIDFYPDIEGFPSPVIDIKKCTNCGLCEKTCPVVNPPQSYLIQQTYASQILSSEVLKDSTSGGLFTAFSQEIFQQGGVVYGCIWDDHYNAIICKAEKEEDIFQMRGSKYVWSWSGDTFSEIKKILDTGKIVLFTGLPCQVAGLRNYLRKDYKNLFLLDFLCSGSPSPRAFRKYLDTICTNDKLAALDFKFRDKNPYGVGVHITYKGQKKKNSPKGEHITNPYYYAFYSHLIDRRSCYQCPYGTDYRISDMTVGDYWGIANYHKNMDIEAGVSALMINTEKGIALLEQVKDKVNLVPTRKEYVCKANNLICDGKYRNRNIPVNRVAFFNELNTRGWNAAEKKYLNNILRVKRWIKAKMPQKMVDKVNKLLES